MSAALAGRARGPPGRRISSPARAWRTPSAAPSRTAPCVLYVAEWFVKLKGLAHGVMWSGTGVAGAALPLPLERLLGRYGFRTTLRVWAVALLVLTMPLASFIKPRAAARGHGAHQTLRVRLRPPPIL